ncbi:hypothetical protein AHAS_Ahas05G0090700 [Arachis hypogaea]
MSHHQSSTTAKLLSTSTRGRERCYCDLAILSWSPHRRLRGEKGRSYVPWLLSRSSPPSVEHRRRCQPEGERESSQRREREFLRRKREPADERIIYTLFGTVFRYSLAEIEGPEQNSDRRLTKDC